MFTCDSQRHTMERRTSRLRRIAVALLAFASFTTANSQAQPAVPSAPDQGIMGFFSSLLSTFVPSASTEEPSRIAPLDSVAESGGFFKFLPSGSGVGSRTPISSLMRVTGGEKFSLTGGAPSDIASFLVDDSLAAPSDASAAKEISSSGSGTADHDDVAETAVGEESETDAVGAVNVVGVTESADNHYEESNRAISDLLRLVDSIPAPGLEELPLLAPQPAAERVDTSATLATQNQTSDEVLTSNMVTATQDVEQQLNELAQNQAIDELSTLNTMAATPEEFGQQATPDFEQQLNELAEYQTIEELSMLNTMAATSVEFDQQFDQVPVVEAPVMQLPFGASHYAPNTGTHASVMPGVQTPTEFSVAQSPGASPIEELQRNSMALMLERQNELEMELVRLHQQLQRYRTSPIQYAAAQQIEQGNSANLQHGPNEAVVALAIPEGYGTMADIQLSLNEVDSLLLEGFAKTETDESAAQDSPATQADRAYLVRPRSAGVTALMEDSDAAVVVDSQEPEDVTLAAEVTQPIDEQQGAADVTKPIDEQEGTDEGAAEKEGSTATGREPPVEDAVASVGDVDLVDNGDILASTAEEGEAVEEAGTVDLSLTNEEASEEPPVDSALVELRPFLEEIEADDNAFVEELESLSLAEKLEAAARQQEEEEDTVEQVNGVHAPHVEEVIRLQVEEVAPLQVEEVEAVQVEEVEAVQVEEVEAVQVEEVLAPEQVEEVEAVQVEEVEVEVEVQGEVAAAPVEEITEVPVEQVGEITEMQVEQVEAVQVEVAEVQVEQVEAMQVEEVAEVQVEVAEVQIEQVEAAEVQIEQVEAMQVDVQVEVEDLMAVQLAGDGVAEELIEEIGAFEDTDTDVATEQNVNAQAVSEKIEYTKESAADLQEREDDSTMDEQLDGDELQEAQGVNEQAEEEIVAVKESAVEEEIEQGREEVGEGKVDSEEVEEEKEEEADQDSEEADEDSEESDEDHEEEEESDESNEDEEESDESDEEEESDESDDEAEDSS
eukprot:GHVT01095102.1.p1 GENE.GHVT01095102.1~~GHVT01095102.1.p1  ORF type:complete len:1009 (+),score=262.38 GHVT01095102.1:2939-5965(+)